MKFRLITLKKNGKIAFSFYPEDIIRIKIDDNKIEIDEAYIFQSKKTIIYKKDYDYPAWQSFLEQLNRIFKL